MGLSGFLDSWLTRDTIFGVPIDDVFSFRTTKIVRVQDRTLGFAPTPSLPASQTFPQARGVPRETRSLAINQRWRHVRDYFC